VVSTEHPAAESRRETGQRLIGFCCQRSALASATVAPS